MKYIMIKFTFALFTLDKAYFITFFYNQLTNLIKQKISSIF